MKKDYEKRCENCANWHPYHDDSGYGDCWAMLTARLITPRWHVCVQPKFKPKGE